MFAVVFRSMTIMLVVVSSYSLVTTIPRLIAVGMNHINNATSVSFDDYWFYMWGALIIAPWNYCGNFFMYVLSGKEFREELALMFCCRERPSGASVYVTLHMFNAQCPVYKEPQQLCITESRSTMQCPLRYRMPVHSRWHWLIIAKCPVVKFSQMS